MSLTPAGDAGRDTTPAWRKRADQAFGLSFAASLLARHARIPMPHRGLAERLADLPVRDLPIEQPVTIRWNDHHVPFIEAANDFDLATALGTVHMHLRAAQIETLRRIAAGRVSEMAGAAAIDIDRAIRALGIRDVVPGIIAMLPERSRLWAQAFLRGFNHHIASARPAPEFAALGITPEPWTLEDFFTLARLFSADLSWPVLRRLLALRDRSGPETWARLWPHILRGGAPDLPPRGNAADDLIEAASRAGAGSNAAAIAAGRTAQGAAIVSGDPHLSIALPNPWVVCCLSSPGINALGLMLPGVPFIALGRNRDVAWGGTSLHAASTDFVDLSSLAPEEFASRTETIKLRGGGSRTITLRTTAHGPVVSDATLFPSKVPLALKWVGHTPSDELTAMLGLLTARNKDDFKATLRGFAVPGQTMVYAGPDGIGRQNAAHLPKRRAGDPADLVVSPETAAEEWATLLRGDALFGEWDPEDGFIASANERLVGPPPDQVPVGYFFAADERVSRIRALLRPAPGRVLDRRGMGALFRDSRQPNALEIRDLLVAHLPREVKPPHAGLVASLRSWDSGYEPESRGALAYELLLGATAHVLLGRTGLGHLETVWTTRALVAAEFANAPPDALARAVAAALPTAARRFRRLGTWGRTHRHRPQHPFGAIPRLGARFRQPEFPAAGGNDTLDKTGHALVQGRHIVRFGATARYVYDLADLDANEVVLFGGQDGWLGSATFADQLPLWRRGAAMRLPLRPEAARADFPHVTVLRPD